MEILATREAVEAVRGKKDSLDKTFTAANLNTSYNKYKGCETLLNYLKTHTAEAKEAALKGHSGALEDKFKKYVKNMDHIPADVPQKYMPQALERVEILQNKVKAPSFQNRTADEKHKIYREIMATRNAVNSSFGLKKTLKRPIDITKLSTAYNRLEQNAAAKDYFTNTPDATLQDRAKGGHGGALESKFKDHVLKYAGTRGIVPKNTDPRYMPEPSALYLKFRTNLIYTLTREENNNDQYYQNENNKKMLTSAVAKIMVMHKTLNDDLDPQKRLKAFSQEKMSDKVNQMVNSHKFKKMIETIGLKTACQKAMQDTIGLLTDFANAPDAPEVQNQDNQINAQNPVVVNNNNMNNIINNNIDNNINNNENLNDQVNNANMGQINNQNNNQVDNNNQVEQNAVNIH